MPATSLFGGSLRINRLYHLKFGGRRSGVTAFCTVPEDIRLMQTEELTYNAKDVELKGFIASPPDASNLPGILVVHEWWGQTEYVRRRTEMLAGLGYLAMAVDLYGNGDKTELPDQAAEKQGALLNTEGLIEARFRAAMETLRNHPLVDSSKIAAVGYCFGGGVVLSMGRAGLELRGVASFHGTLNHLQPAKVGAQAKFLVLTGDSDPFVPDEDLQQFKAEMTAARLDCEVVEYPGVKHAFTNPKADQKGELYDLPLRYDPDADVDSWGRLQNFLQKVFA